MESTKTQNTSAPQPTQQQPQFQQQTVSQPNGGLNGYATPTPQAFEELRERVARLEELVSPRSVSSASRNAATNPSPRDATHVSNVAYPSQIGSVVVKGSSSRYHGQNDRVTLLNQFTEAKESINEISRDPQITGLAKQVQFLQGKSKSKIASPDTENTDFSLALLKLREFLPSKSTCDRLLNVYWRHFEQTMRILHIPTFMQRYSQIWMNTDPEICTTSSTIPQVTVVLIMAHAVDRLAPPDDGSDHTSAYLKGAAGDLIQAWLDELGRKRRNEFATIQVEALLLLARSLRNMPPEKIWSATGTLVRNAMVMGLHMDPSKVAKITPFYAEMRRRLWATIMEMDIQASMNAGMPILSLEADFSPLVPSNLDDADFDENCTRLPPAKPLSTMTDSLAQVYLASSLSQRIRALSLLQKVSSEVDVVEVMREAKKLEDWLSRKPAPLRLDNDDRKPNDAGSLVHRILTDLYVRRPLLCLYRPLLLGERQDNPFSSEISRLCLESSLVILSYQDYYDARNLEDDPRMPSSYRNFFYVACKNDVLWAALSICQHVEALNRQTNMDPTDQISEQHKSTLINAIQNTIDRFTTRIGQRDSDLKDVMFLSVALESVRSSRLVQGKSQVMYEMAKRTLSACRENLMDSVVMGNKAHSVPDSTSKRPKSVQKVPTRTPTTPLMRSPPATDPLPNLSPPLELDSFLSATSDLGVEFSNFHGEAFGFGTDPDFTIDANWNWDNMWQ
ncbi:uncharacterized protein CC84DRAFT_1257465 [Paraphaeosphaeria sporulosa]|uniref:Xylanolytic transcriptional activator regulatory domain-containing protein n=1 Tax=Paraphaeosphaeria sporulosa TaxID=1460663 RepID=A0A177CPD1_9PLEO|nr:uncharacterized protein CC84DRAFT_1257465 [Paraphaeosphaeria sporulosa]OAG08649.1 hypothetical protein CC84DRAFT_1257465 [Paraphaeosphaeria sporulosa]